MASKNTYGADVVLTNLTLGYSHLETPRPKENKDKTAKFNEYGGQFYIDKTDAATLDEVQAAIEEVCQLAGIAEETLNITAIRDVKNRIRDCDSPAYTGKSNTLAGHIFFDASSSVAEDSQYGAPTLQVQEVDAAGEIAFRDALPGDIYPGCKVAVILTNCVKYNESFKNYSHKFFLQSVIKIADGERLNLVAGGREENKAKAEELLKNKLKGSTLNALKAKTAAPKPSVTVASAKAPAAVARPAKVAPVAAPVVEEVEPEAVPAAVVQTPKRKLSSLLNK